ncbi:hypothetical protein FOA52_007428 [Chlamydomonas sp. UWO 241]|nr:hypothetical protein FOA52_007428 [Chlamydomonas sp. UWO 241]
MAHGEEVEDDDNVYGDYQRPEKRARLGEKIFPKATIMKIKVHDFMTYAGTVTITPGPGLNLVLGPNGTGKSSLVCAMCVGLGGSTKLLGRADDLREYIRRGKTSAWTEITLSGGPTERDHVVRRDIKFETNSEGRPVCHSLWKINGNPRTHKAVTELMKVNNVQLDNLCQFLPQDKVVEFARLNPQQLLEETEKAIGDAELHRLHMHLVETKVSFDSEKERRDNNDRTLQRTMQEHERQQNEYQRFFQRKTLQKEIDTLQAKILWLEYAESQRRFAESKLKLSKGKELLATRKSELKEDTRPIQMLEGRVRQLKAEREAASRELSALKRDVANKASMADATKADLDKAIGEKASLKEQSKLRLKKLEGLQTAVSQLEAEIAAAPSAAPAEMTDRLVELYAQTQEADQRCQTINEEQIAISHERNDLERRVQELEKKLEAMNNVKIQRLKVMERKKHGIAQVWKWVQDNKGRFKGEVLGPIGLEISATREFAGFLETHIGGTLNHFVTSCREDEEILSGWLKDNQNVLHNNFTVTTYGADPNAPVRHPLGNASHYQHLGVLHTLDEVFTTDHQVIKHVLCNMTGIDKVYVASPNSSVEDILNAMPKPVAGKGLQMTVYMGTSKFSNTISAYNPIGKSYAQNEVRPADVLTGALPSDAESERAQLQAEKKQLEAQRRSADERRAAGEQQAKAAEQRRDGLYVQCQKLSEQIEKIKRKRGELTRLLNVKASRTRC